MTDETQPKPLYAIRHKSSGDLLELSNGGDHHEWHHVTTWPDSDLILAGDEEVVRIEIVEEADRRERALRDVVDALRAEAERLCDEWSRLRGCEAIGATHYLSTARQASVAADMIEAAMGWSEPKTTC
jgi:hypothetical protein